MRGKCVVLGAAFFMAWPALSDAQDPGPRLKPPPVDPITIRRPQPFPWAAATFTGLDGDDVRDFGGRFFTDSLRRVPGLEVQRVSSTESNVSARSYNDDSSASQGILGLLDGRQVYNDFFGGVFWDAIPMTLDEIKAIEVIRGPGSFLHGPNAMHGLVNFITKSPLDYAEGTTAGHEVFLSVAGGSHRANVESLTFVKREGNTVTCRITADMPFPLSDLTSETRAVLNVEPGVRYERRWTLVSGDYLSHQGGWVLVPFAGDP